MPYILPVIFFAYAGAHLTNIISCWKTFSPVKRSCACGFNAGLIAAGLVTIRLL